MIPHVKSIMVWQCLCFFSFAFKFNNLLLHIQYDGLPHILNLFMLQLFLLVQHFLYYLRAQESDAKENSTLGTPHGTMYKKAI